VIRLARVTAAATGFVLSVSGTAVAQNDVTLDGFGGPLREWQRGTGLTLARTAVDGDPALAIRSGSNPGDWSGPLSRRLPGSGPVAISLDIGIATGGEVGLFGPVGGAPALVLRRTPTALVVTAGDRRWVLRARADGAPLERMLHVEAVAGKRLQFAVDGVPIDPPIRPGRSLELRVRRKHALLQGFIVSPLDDRGALLLHRLAAIHASTPPGRAQLGVGSDGTVRYHAGWTRGFWPGALWQAAEMTPDSDLFERWALRATVLNFGAEDADTHDVGFMYGRSSVAAYERLCRTAAPDPSCPDLLDSGLTAADSLALLAEANIPAGMIPTRLDTLCRDCASLEEAETIIDSMMNLSLLLWAARESPERAYYREIALAHAAGVARTLVRSDGSTAQAVRYMRADGSLVAIHTHQGVSDASTWSRGESWALYGFAETALLTRSTDLLAVAGRTAGYVESHLPLAGVPPYDYDAPLGAPTDTSAGVIAAAGLFRLEDACRRLRACADDGRRWGRLGERMLDASLAAVRLRPRLGLFGGQVFSLGGVTPWDDSGEFMFGLDFAVEAVRLRAER
jgi:unsaturated chondroitin disaccharide hydrolase